MCTNVYIQETDWRKLMSEDCALFLVYIQSFSVAMEKLWLASESSLSEDRAKRIETVKLLVESKTKRQPLVDDKTD